MIGKKNYSFSSLKSLAMNSSAISHRDRAKIVPKECDNIFPAKRTPSSRRTPSFSSSSSSLSSCSSSLGSSYFPDDSPLSPATPLRFTGVPFSWEHLPGIPKKNNNNNAHKKKESLLEQLPLPPPATPANLKKLHFDPHEVSMRKKFNSNGTDQSFRKDPFVAALVECSKDDDDDNGIEVSSSKFFWNSAKVSRSISDRFGFVNLYTSCKRTCAVSESIVYLPRSSRTSYNLIHHRPSR